jgi:hypothetical protein
MQRALHPHRHCGRSEAIQNLSVKGFWIASSQELLAMTSRETYARNDGDWRVKRGRYWANFEQPLTP